MIEFVFAEFNSKNNVPEANLRKYFPDCKITVITEKDVSGPYTKGTTRWGNRMNDYWKVHGILESKEDLAIAMDADTLIASELVHVLPLLARRFGLCLPANPRLTVRKDTIVGADSDRKLDSTLGMGYAYNMTPIAFHTRNVAASYVLDKYLEIMRSSPVRGPLAMWRAVYDVGFAPYLLPPQWCVCASDVGIEDPVILHVGHEEVRRHYAR